jgi:hypothetical protein
VCPKVGSEEEVLVGGHIPEVELLEAPKAIDLKGVRASWHEKEREGTQYRLT